MDVNRRPYSYGDFSARSSSSSSRSCHLNSRLCSGNSYFSRCRWKSASSLDARCVLADKELLHSWLQSATTKRTIETTREAIKQALEPGIQNTCRGLLSAQKPTPSHHRGHKKSLRKCLMKQIVASCAVAIKYARQFLSYYCLQLAEATPHVFNSHQE